jgi:hypothetical protein
MRLACAPHPKSSPALRHCPCSCYPVHNAHPQALHVLNLLMRHRRGVMWPVDEVADACSRATLWAMDATRVGTRQLRPRLPTCLCRCPTSCTPPPTASCACCRPSTRVNGAAPAQKRHTQPHHGACLAAHSHHSCRGRMATKAQVQPAAGHILCSTSPLPPCTCLHIVRLPMRFHSRLGAARLPQATCECTATGTSLIPVLLHCL